MFLEAPRKYAYKKLVSNAIRHFRGWGGYKCPLPPKPTNACPTKRGFANVESEGVPVAPPLNRIPFPNDRGSKNDVDMWPSLCFALHRMGCFDTHRDQIMRCGLRAGCCMVRFKGCVHRFVRHISKNGRRTVERLPYDEGGGNYFCTDPLVNYQSSSLFPKS